MRARLNDLPKTPNDAYDGILQRLPSSDGLRRHVRQILGWILHAQRRLEMPELREALALQEHGTAGLDGVDHADESEATKIL
jgi:hypothetical protein